MGARTKSGLPGIYNSTALTLADGDGSALATNSAGVLLVSTENPSGANFSQALTQVTTKNLKASAGRFLTLFITNKNAAVRYFQIHNKATAPAGADVPLFSVPIPSGNVNSPGYIILDEGYFTGGGLVLSIGVSWAISTTMATFTDSATNTEHDVAVNYL